MIKIYTFAHKRPDFIELQFKSFKKNIKEDFEFIVFNNANFDVDRTHYDGINKMCQSLGCQVIDIQKDNELATTLPHSTDPILFGHDGAYTNANMACAYPLCYAWQRILSKTDDKICIIDSDMFVTHPIELSPLLDKYQLCFVPQIRHNEINEKVAEYMWNGIVLANLQSLPDKEKINWWCGRVKDIPVDVGGQTTMYLDEHPELKLLHIRVRHIPDEPTTNFHPSNYEIIWLEDQQAILHYRSGSNWNNMSPDYHVKKTRWLRHKLG